MSRGYFRYRFDEWREHHKQFKHGCYRAYPSIPKIT